MNPQHYPARLYRRLQAGSSLFIFTSLILISVLSVANASQIDDDLNYIGKAEDYDKVVAPFECYASTLSPLAITLLTLFLLSKAGLAMGQNLEVQVRPRVRRIALHHRGQ